MIYQKMIATKQIGKNKKKLDSEHNIENNIDIRETFVLYRVKKFCYADVKTLRKFVSDKTVTNSDSAIKLCACSLFVFLNMNGNNNCET